MDRRSFLIGAVAVPVAIAVPIVAEAAPVIAPAVDVTRAAGKTYIFFFNGVRIPGLFGERISEGDRSFIVTDTPVAYAS